MRTKNFRWFLLLCMAFGIANVAKSQIYSSEVGFYSREGGSKVEYAVKFENYNKMVLLKSVSNTKVRDNLAKSEKYYENDTWTDKKDGVKIYEYDSQRSTYAREVYKRKDTRNSGRMVNEYIKGWGYVTNPELIPGYSYVAFSTDSSISSFIMWFEDEKNYDGKIRNREDYSRVPKEDLLPKAVNDDFLY